MSADLISNIIRGILLVFSLVVRAFFAGSETAFLAMDKWAVDSLANEGDERALLLKKMKENSKNTVSALLVGTNICTILFSVLAVSLSYAIGLEGPAYLGLVSLLTTAVVFVFSDLMPKTFAAVSYTHLDVYKRQTSHTKGDHSQSVGSVYEHVNALSKELVYYFLNRENYCGRTGYVVNQHQFGFACYGI